MANIVLTLSGGAANTTPNNALGGAISVQGSSAQITTSDVSLNNLFDNISKSENFAGTTDYRCIYISNITGSGSFSTGEVYLSGSSYADIQVGFDTAGANGTATTIANETSVPSGVNFSTPSSQSALPFGPGNDLDEGDYIALWIKRTANNIPGTGTVTDTIGLSVRGVE